MNFNQHANEYDLSGSVTEELIRLYGTQCKLVITIQKHNIKKSIP